MADSFKNLIRPTVLFCREVAERIKALEDAGGGGSVNAGQGALISLNEPVVGPGQLITNLAPTLLTFDATVFDDLGFFSLLNPQDMEIPVTVPQITRVQIWTRITWNGNGVGIREVISTLNNVQHLGSIMDTRNNPGAGTASEITAMSGPVNIVPTDMFQLVVRQDSGGGLHVRSAEFGIIVLR
jgi:hypothetical protein